MKIVTDSGADLLFPQEILDEIENKEIIEYLTAENGTRSTDPEYKRNHLICPDIRKTADTVSTFRAYDRFDIRTRSLIQPPSTCG